jgi:hypothetical protein
VEYSEMNAKYELVSDDLEEDFDTYGDSDLEVIGNIHDNPELLEKTGGTDNARN